MNKIYLTTFLLLVAVFTVAYLYFSTISAGSRNNDKALSLIPNDAALILTFKNDKDIYEIFRDYTVFEAIAGKQKKEEISALKSILLNSDQSFRSSKGQNIFLSFHPLKSDSVAFLWIMPMPQKSSDSDVIKSLKSNSSLVYKENKIFNLPIIEAQIKSLNRPFYIYIDKNVILGSFSRTAVENSLDLNSPKISADFTNEINQASNPNQNAPASVFVNYRGSIPFLSKFFKNNLSGNFSLLNNFNAIATLNLNFKSDALMFNGMTKPDTTQNNFINLFLNQQPVKNPIKRVVPSNTANFIAYGVSNYNTFHRDLKGLLKKRNEIEKINTSLNVIREESGINVDRDIRKYWGNEFITFQLSTQEKFAAIKLTNGRQMQFFMEPLSSAYSPNIRHLNYPGLLYYYFGDGFKQFNKPFYTIVDNLMILSNSPGSLNRYLTRYSRNSLYENDRFLVFDQLVADQSNISVFVHNKNSRSNIKSLLKPEYAKALSSDNYGLKEFYGFSYQLNSENDQFFTNFYAGYAEKPADTSLSIIPDSIK